MKKLFSLFIIASFCFSQASAQVTFNPTIFTADDQVTVTVDVTGTPMAGQPEAYIWIFSNPTAGSGPQKDGSVNGSWTNSSVEAKMTAAGTNRWSFTFTGTTLFNLTPGELKEFGFLIKARDGSRQTPDYKPFKFDPLVFTPSTFRIFPSKVGQNDVVTAIFDQGLASTINETRMTPVSVTFTVYDQNNNVFGNPVTVPVRALGNRMWGASFLPTRSYTIPATTKLSKFRYKFNGNVIGSNGAPALVSTEELEVPFLDLK